MKYNIYDKKNTYIEMDNIIGSWIIIIIIIITIKQIPSMAIIIENKTQKARSTAKLINSK